MNAKALFTGFFVLAGLFGTAGPAFSQQSPPPSEQVKKIEALVDKAAALVNSKGKAAFAEFRKETKPPLAPLFSSVRGRQPSPSSEKRGASGGLVRHIYSPTICISTYCSSPLFHRTRGKIKRARQIPTASCTMTSLSKLLNPPKGRGGSTTCSPNPVRPNRRENGAT